MLCLAKIIKLKTHIFYSRITFNIIRIGMILPPFFVPAVYKCKIDYHAMSKSQLHAFIDRARCDEQFRSQLSSMNPKQIIEFAMQNGFQFSDEIKGRFINRWKGVYFCPQAIEVGLLCPGLVPDGYRNLLHYSQSTCSSSNLKEEEHDFRSGHAY